MQKAPLLAGRMLVRVVRLSWLRGQDLNLRPSGYEPIEGRNRKISENSGLRGKPLFLRDFYLCIYRQPHGLKRKLGARRAVAG
jgi:hypothetical protein